MWQAPRSPIAESLDRQLLERAEPPIVADAAALLCRKGITCHHVVAVDVDSILYIDRGGRAKTAWLHREQGGLVRVWIEAGFAAERGFQDD